MSGQDKTPSQNVGGFRDLNQDNKESFNNISSALSPDNLGQSESLSNIHSHVQFAPGTATGTESPSDHSKNGSTAEDATSGSGLLPASNKDAPDGESKSNGPKEFMKQRFRKLSEPSSAFGRGDTGSQKSLGKSSHRSRQDSVRSAGFGSRKSSIYGSQKLNYVTEAASIIPTLSIDHIPHLTELYPQNYDRELDDLEAGEDSGLVGESERPEEVGLVGGEEDNWAHKPELENGAAGRRKSSLKKPAPPEPEMTPEELEAFKKTERRKYMKNLLVLCTGFFFVFTAFLSLRNLQSSLNAKGGLGLYALSSTYACFFLGCIMATTIVQRLGPKRAIVLSTIGPFLYVLANFYPLFYTLIPAAAAAGFCQGVIWTAHATYIANIAASYTALTNEKIQNVLSRFNGIFFVFYQSCQIIGGMISAIVLKSPEDPLDSYFLNGTMFNGTMYDNETMFGNETFPMYYMNMNRTRDYSHCGRGYCPGKGGAKDAAPVDRVLVFTLVGIFTGCCLTGILVLAFLLDSLEGQMKKTQSSVGKQLAAVFKFYFNRYAICMVGLMFYSLLQAAFIFGEYNKAFVTCTIGIHMVGFVMMTMSSCSAVAAFFNGRIQKYTGRPPLLAIGFLFQFGVFMTLLAWQPTPADTPVFFILVMFWGVGDGIIMTQDISIIGFLFADNKEPAFAALKMTQSIANFSFFIVSPYLCTVRKIAFVLTVLIIATTGYFALELILKMESRREKRKKAAELHDETKEPIKT